MRTGLLVPVSIASMLLLAACGSSGKSAAPTTTAPAGPTTTVHVAQPVGAKPSKSAQMICEKEAIDAIEASATGVKTTSITTPTWNDHVYACDYMYPGGVKIGLSVKELSDAAETTAYFDSLATKLGKAKDVSDLGQPAFQTHDGSIVIRKDYKVLTVDVSKLPGQFGVPVAPRGDVAINVASTLMGCWTGA